MAMALVAALAASSAAYLALMALAAAVLRIGMLGYTLGFGPVVTRTPSFTLRAVPLGASFLPASRNGRLPVPDALRALLARGELRCFEDLPLGVGLSLSFASLLVPFVGASAMLGVHGAVDATAAAARDYVAGVLAPVSEAPRLLDAAFAVYRGASRASTAGHTFAVTTALELLYGANNLLFLIALPSPSLVLPRVRFLVFLAIRLMDACWCVGFVLWLLRG